MEIAELYRNQSCMEDLTAELPEGIEYDRSSECLRLTEPFDEAASWGPFRFELVRSPADAHLSVRTTDRTRAQVRLFVRLKVKGERWLMLLNFADTDAASSAETADEGETEACNTIIVVNVRQQTLYLKAQRPLLPGEMLTTRLSSSDNCDDEKELTTCDTTDSEQEALQHGGIPSLDDDIPTDSEEHREDNEDASAASGGTAEEQQRAPPATNRHQEVRKRPASANDIGTSVKLPRLQSGARRSAVQAEASLRSRIRYCNRCGLFFTSVWMLQTHRQFHDLFDASTQQLLNERDTPQLVLSAPVLSDRGSIAYVPVGLPRVSAQLSASQQQQQQQQQEEELLQQVATASVASDVDGSSPDLAEATALDLTVPRMPTPALATASSRLSHPEQQQQQRMRIRQSQQHDLQQLQQEQSDKSSSSVSSLMSVCKDCKIGFFNYNNYVVHRSLYCQSSRLAAAAAASPTSSTPGRQQKQQQQPPSQMPPAALATPKLEAMATPVTSAPVAAGTSANSPTMTSTERKFQCPYCQIRFHSPSTLTAHQAFYCPENPDKAAPAPTSSASAAGLAAASSTAPAAVDAAGAAAAGTAAPPSQPQHPPSWLPISLDLSGSAGYKCSICGYIGQTERGMKMHAKVHSGGFGGCAGNSGVNGASSSALSPSDASTGDGIRLPTSFSSDLLSSMTPEELGMLQHKTQPYSKRRTFKRMAPPPQTLPQQQQQLQLPLSLHPSLLRHQLHQLHHQQAINAGAAAAASSAAGFRLAQCGRDSGDSAGQLVCVRCGEPFDQLESLLEHQETACPGLNAAAAAAAAAVEAAAAAAVKLESVGRV